MHKHGVNPVFNLTGNTDVTQRLTADAIRQGGDCYFDPGKVTSALTHGTRLRRGAEGRLWQHHPLGCQPHASQTAAFCGREGRPPYRLSFTSLTNSGICRNLVSPDVSQKTPSSPRKPAFLSR